MREYDGTSPLPDSDIVSSAESETETETNVQSTDAPNMKEAASRRRWSHSDDYAVASITEGDNTVGYLLAAGEVGGIPVVSRDYLAYLGFTILMARSPDLTAAYARVQSGEVAVVKKGGRPAKPNFWRQAIALAFVDATKKAPGGQMTFEAATEKSTGLDIETVKRLKLDPVVVRHHNKLAGGTAGYSVLGLLQAETVAA